MNTSSKFGQKRGCISQPMLGGDFGDRHLCLLTAFDHLEMSSLKDAAPELG